MNYQQMDEGSLYESGDYDYLELSVRMGDPSKQRRTTLHSFANAKQTIVAIHPQKSLEIAGKASFRQRRITAHEMTRYDAFQLHKEYLGNHSLQSRLTLNEVINLAEQIALDYENYRDRDSSDSSLSWPEDVPRVPSYTETAASRKHVIFLSAAINHFLVMYLIASFGAFYAVITEHFDISKMAASLIGSIQAGITFGAGIFFAPIVERIGSRLLIQLGGVIIFLGYTSSAFTPNVYLMYLTYGLLSGSGIAILYFCTLIEIQKTFSGNITFAVSAVAIGYSGGSIAAGFTLPHLLAAFGWRGTIALVGVFVLNAVPLGCAFSARRSSSNVSQQKLSIDEQDDDTCSRIKLISRVIREALNFKIFLNPMFALFCLGRFCVRFAFCASFSLTPTRAIAIGLTLQQGTQLMSMYSIATLLFRLVFGVFTYRRQVSNIITVIVCSVAGAAFMMAIAVTINFWWLVAWYMAFGIFVGTTATLLPAIVFDLFGMNNIARNQAMSLLVEGFCYLIAAPVAGAIVDRTDSFFQLFILLSIGLFAGAILLTIVHLMDKRHASKLRNVKDCAAQNDTS